jgi:hypothetical protein
MTLARVDMNSFKYLSTMIEETQIVFLEIYFMFINLVYNFPRNTVQLYLRKLLCLLF